MKENLTRYWYWFMRYLVKEIIIYLYIDDFIRFHLFLHVLIFSSQHNQCQPAMTFVTLLTRIPKTRNNENLKQKTQNSKWKILKKNSKHKTKQKHTCFSLYSYCFMFFWTIIASNQIDLVCYPNNKNSMGRGINN